MRYWLVGGVVAGVATSGIVMIVQAAFSDPEWRDPRLLPSQRECAVRR